MTITVDWATRIIHVPKADTTLVQLTPTEIRSLDLNWFRLQLKDLEDNPEGMSFPDTHRHNTAVTVGGVDLARVIEIINNYTITFEDGQWAVNLLGANSNVGDRVNVNQVSVRSANSAGLVTSAAIEFGEYGGGVTIDIASGEPGTIYPIGTGRRPSNNMADALLIANANGFRKFFVRRNLTLVNSDYSNGFIFVGESVRLTNVTIQTLADVTACEFQNMTVSGTLDGNNTLRDCIVGAINYVEGQIVNSTLLDVLLLAGTAVIRVEGCRDGTAGSMLLPVFDCDGGGRDLIITDYDGSLEVRNLALDDNIEIAIARGHVHIDPSVTAGAFVLAGVADVVNLGSPTSLDVSALMSKSTVAGAVLDAAISSHTVSDTVGLTLARNAYAGKIFFDSVLGSPGTAHPVGTFGKPVNNLADLKVLLVTYNINHVHLHSGLTLTTGTVVDFLVFESHPSYLSLLTFEPGVSGVDCIFQDIKVTGILEAPASFTRCYLEGVTGLAGMLDRCMLDGVVTLLPGADLQMTNCRSRYSAPVTLSVGSAKITAIGWVGMLNVTDKADATKQFNLAMDWGSITLDATCTAGVMNIFGQGWLADNSNGATVLTSGMINKDITAQAVWDHTQ